MGILDTFFPSRTTTNATPDGEYLPASDTALARTGSAIRDGGTAMLSRAGEIYKANPKKIQALGILAGAILLSRMKRN